MNVSEVVLTVVGSLIAYIIATILITSLVTGTAAGDTLKRKWIGAFGSNLRMKTRLIRKNLNRNQMRQGNAELNSGQPDKCVENIYLASQADDDMFRHSVKAEKQYVSRTSFPLWQLPVRLSLS